MGTWNTGPTLLGAFEILGYPQRVDVLRVLRAEGTPMSLRTLTRHLTEGGASGSSWGDPVDGSYLGMELHHAHLPKLDDGGVIRYDPDEKVVTDLNDARLDTLVESGRRVLRSLEADRCTLVSNGDEAERARLASLIEAGHRTLESLREVDRSVAATSSQGGGSGTEPVVRLPETQRRLLCSAHREGYFETPRKLTLEELAMEHDLSLLAASQELRRGLDAVLDAVELRADDSTR